jgi:hypothetical protein
VNAPLNRGGSGRAPLLGHNLVRLVYLDEAGTDYKVSHLCVAGVIVHGDLHPQKIDQMFDGLESIYIPLRDRRLGFQFHATDIFHGAGYFDRRKTEWPEARRMKLLADIASVIEALSLPVVVGYYEKLAFGAGALPPNMPKREREEMIQNAATVDCLMRTDRWLEKFSPSENATVIHEDGPRSKKIIKSIVRALRNSEFMESARAAELRNVGLPLKRIIDTVHFAAKPDARALQLADLCAFIFGRLSKKLPVPKAVEEIIFRHAAWLFKDNYGSVFSAARASEPSSEGAP